MLSKREITINNPKPIQGNSDFKICFQLTLIRMSIAMQLSRQTMALWKKHFFGKGIASGSTSQCIRDADNPNIRHNAFIKQPTNL
jgi:hypothetical protein